MHMGIPRDRCMVLRKRVGTPRNASATRRNGRTTPARSESSHETCAQRGMRAGAGLVHLACPLAQSPIFATSSWEQQAELVVIVSDPSLGCHTHPAAAWAL